FARIREYIVPLKKPPIDTIAVTVGPGLEPALWVGINFAKALSVLWDKPIIPVNHMEGHIFSALLQKSGKDNFQFLNFQFPMIALLVSGGHTELVLMNGIGKYKIVGETLDDAAGEAFDKVARLLGLGYPGGPEIENLSSIQHSVFSNMKHSVFDKIKLPRPMINSKDFNFSFSGLKTAVLYLIRDLENSSINSGQERYNIKKLRPAIAREFQNAIVEVLVKKTVYASKKYNAKKILLGGGVAANKLLRQDLAKQAKVSKVGLLTSPLELTGDNALMIAVAAFFQKKKALRSRFERDSGQARKNISLLRAKAHLRLSSR
ncbi:MAG: tRNA (adenosine(37)-N6)-threonylcarbamoyltransferase complex transferase subunit TsaD, partial [Candidatus Niyogibacteria bacterium]|nr:tRNA (adenosine(37)-N6)-threonylcarbamoyltransferase complex transferase subunit TsaD [Candidatus Niyogibacteria bacterium]